jgi:hypothetical protein
MCALCGEGWRIVRGTNKGRACLRKEEKGYDQNPNASVDDGR